MKYLPQLLYPIITNLYNLTKYIEKVLSSSSWIGYDTVLGTELDIVGLGKI